MKFDGEATGHLVQFRDRGLNALVLYPKATIVDRRKCDSRPKFNNELNACVVLRRRIFVEKFRDNGTIIFEIAEKY